MTRKIIGAVLLIAGLGLGAVLLVNGRLVFPHILGPSTLIMIGVLLLAIKAKTNRSVQ